MHAESVEFRPEQCAVGHGGRGVLTGMVRTDSAVGVIVRVGTNPVADSTTSESIANSSKAGEKSAPFSTLRVMAALFTEGRVDPKGEFLRGSAFRGVSRPLEVGAPQRCNPPVRVPFLTQG